MENRAQEEDWLAIEQWRTRACDLTEEDLREIVRRSRHMAKLVIDTACDDVVITDAEIRKHKSIYVRRELIAAKVTAWEWFFGPHWLGQLPRLSLEEVCPVLHLNPDWIRERVRQAKIGAKWVDGYMDGDTKVYGRWVGGVPNEPTKFKLPPGYRVAELYHEGNPLPSDSAEKAAEAAAAAAAAALEEGEVGDQEAVAEKSKKPKKPKKPKKSKKSKSKSKSKPKSKPKSSRSKSWPPMPPGRAADACALKQSFASGPRPPPKSLREEAAASINLAEAAGGFDDLGNAASGIVIVDDDDQ